MSRYLGSSKNIRDQKIIDGYEIPTPFTTAVDMIPIKVSQMELSLPK